MNTAVSFAGIAIGAALVFAGPISQGTNQPASNRARVVMYDELSDNPKRIAPPSAVVAKVKTNPDKLQIELTVLSLDDVKMRKELWEGMKPKDGADVRDTVAMVCEYTLTTEPNGLWIAQPYIDELSHINKHYAADSSEGRLQPVARRTLNFAQSFNMTGSVAGDMGVVVVGQGTITYIWMLPAMNTTFRVVFPPHDYSKGQEHEIRVALSAGESKK